MDLIKRKSRHGWYLLILLLITYIAVEVPVRLVIHKPAPAWTILADLLITVFFGIDIWLHFKFPVFRRGKWYTDSRFIAKAYRQRWFYVDLIAALPFELILALFVSAPEFDLVLKLVHLTRLAKLARLWSLRRYFQYFFQINYSVFRLIFFAYLIGLLSHWIACGWFRVTIYTTQSASFSDAYINCLYWCITTLTTVGYGDVTPSDSLQKIYTMIVMILGVGVYGYVIGNVASIMGNLDLAKAHHQERVEKVNAFMINNKFAPALQTRVKDYFSYLWESRRGYDHGAVFEELPESFKLDFAVFLHKDIIAKVPMFKNASEEFVKDLVLNLQPYIFLPADIICRYGEIGDRMYFINQGVVEVVAADGMQVYTTLSDGAYFGEIALLMETPRTATIRAVDYCELYAIDKQTFDGILGKYPEVEREIKQIARARLEELEQTGKR